MVSGTGTRTVSAAALAASLLLLDGCAAGSIFGARSSTETSVADADIGTSSLAIYLQTMQQLIEGDALIQAATFNELREAAALAPTPTNRLLYALALAVPGHAGSDAEAAASRLQTLLASGPALLPEERMLAEIQLQMTNQLIMLESARASIEQEAAGAQQNRDAEYDERLRQLRAENEALRTELEDAKSMLDAITNIERSLSEREPTDE